MSALKFLSSYTGKLCNSPELKKDLAYQEYALRLGLNVFIENDAANSNRTLLLEAFRKGAEQDLYGQITVMHQGGATEEAIQDFLVRAETRKEQAAALYQQALDEAFAPSSSTHFSFPQLRSSCGH